jgi:hypothetical protein
MKSAAVFQALAAQSGNYFKPAYRPDGMKLAGWNIAFCAWPKTAATGCKLISGFVLTLIPELSAGATTDASCGIPGAIAAASGAG